MNRNDIILWFGRIATIIFTIAVVWDIYNDRALSWGIRTVVVSTVAAVFAALFVWQVYVAQKYDGWPLIPFSFRWTMASWLGSMALFLVWIIMTSITDTLYSDLRSAIVWWQFGTSTLWFMARWLTVETPHQAGIGETGSSK